MAFREGPFNDLKLPVAWLAVGATAVAVIIALMLLLSERKSTVAMSGHAPVRNAFDKVIEPVGGVLVAPIRFTGGAIGYVEGYFFAVSENRKLRAQIRDLEGSRDAAIALKNVNDRYEALLKIKTEPPIPMVSARTVMDARGPFANARFLDVGTEAGVQIGDPVISEHGVVGRIAGTTKGASRLLMLTDVESRTPVLMDRTNARAILTGDGGAYPRLEYVRGRDPLKVGDMILTSGDGGVFPRGLPVGVAAKDLKGAWRVRLYSDQTAIDYVRVLLFQDFSTLVSPAALASPDLPPLTAAEAADRAAALAKAAKPATSPVAATPGTTPTPAPAPITPPSTTKPHHGKPPKAAAPAPQRDAATPHP
ncbi:MAG: rod shape-determining protein MreC [Caulobacteraceae bacterium]